MLYSVVSGAASLLQPMPVIHAASARAPACANVNCLLDPASGVAAVAALSGSAKAAAAAGAGLAAAGIADPAGVWRNKNVAEGVCSWYDAGVRLEGPSEPPAAASPVAAAPAAAAAAAVPADKPAVMKKLVSGFVEPMPPPGFVWSDVELDVSGVVYPTAAATAAEPKDEVAVDDAEAPIEGLSVAQACMFFAANPSVDAAEKKAFLASKGVSEFVITQAECTASGMESTVHGHPGEGDEAETTEGWPLLGGINKWHPKAGPWPADAARVWLD